MRTLWSNSRERMEDYEKRQDEDSSCPKGLEILLKETTVQTPRTSTIPKLRLKIMTFANLNEFWNSKMRFLDTTKRSMSFLEAGVPRSWQTNWQTDDWDDEEEMHKATVCKGIHDEEN